WDSENGDLEFAWLDERANGGFRYEPEPAFVGTDSFTYRASDGTELSNLATVTITVEGFNQAPAAANDLFSTPQDTPLTVAAPGLLANDSDPNDDSLVAITDTNPAQGTLTLGGAGDIWLPETVDSRGDVGQYSSLAAIVGQPAISYYDARTRDLKFARLGLAGWQSDTVDSAGDVGQYSSLAEVAGRPAISYYDTTNGDLKFAYRNGTTWQIETVDSSALLGSYTSLAVVNGQPMIAYTKAYNMNRALVLARRNLRGWQIEIIDETIAQIGSSPSLAEVAGQPAIAYMLGSNLDLGYARYDGSAWQIEVVERVPAMLYTTVSLAVVGGQPAISYPDEGYLRYARHNGAFWQVETVDIYVAYPSLAAVDGQPANSYQDTANEALKYARYDGSTWQIETVDSAEPWGGAGYYTSLAVVDGQPVISHYDATRKNLKVASNRTTGDGGFTFVPEPGFCGVARFLYHAYDGSVASNKAPVVIIVGCSSP
ncbi:MAG: Ig-like domain-containing protein, partial [Ardenticatenaceae bacterium]